MKSLTTKALAMIGLTLATLALCGHGASAQCPPGQPCPPRYGQPVYTAQYTVGVAPRYTTPAAEPRYHAPTPAPRVASYYATAPTATRSTVGAVQGDGQVFLNWLNATRAQHGLSAVTWDDTLASWAQANNAQQVARDRGGFGSGLGHWTMGTARRQNAGWNYRDAREAGESWMTSAGHRAALLDPTIRRIGLARSGSYWTFDGS